jgi:pilus assembly protein Flp/PilA
MLEIIKRLYSDVEGQGLAEYALILALIAIIVIGALTILGKKVNNTLQNVADNL